MIILDITNLKRNSTWPDSTPNKIRLEKGKHFKEDDTHPMCRNTKWYKALKKNLIDKYPVKDTNLPIGINSHELIDSVKILEV